MPSGITNNAIDQIRVRRAVNQLRAQAGSVYGVMNNPTSKEEMRRSIRGLSREFTPAPGIPIPPTAIDPVRVRRGVEALRRAT